MKNEKKLILKIVLAITLKISLKLKILLLIIFYWIENHKKHFWPLRSIFYQVDEFIWVFDWNKYLILFGSEKYDATQNRIRYLISQKSSVTHFCSHNYARNKIDSSDSLPLEKSLTLDNVIILIKSVSNKNQNHYYYNIFLEKCFYQLPKFNDNKWVFI